MTGPVIATALSRSGGRLHCGHIAEAGDRIFKIDTGERGGSTQQGQGYGAWICGPCSENQPEASAE
jgi:hypothetical protein